MPDDDIRQNYLFAIPLCLMAQDVRTTSFFPTIPVKIQKYSFVVSLCPTTLDFKTICLIFQRNIFSIYISHNQMTSDMCRCVYFVVCVTDSLWCSVVVSLKQFVRVANWKKKHLVLTYITFRFLRQLWTSANLRSN